MQKKFSENTNAVEVFQQLCDQSDEVTAFVAVALDENGMVSIGSMSLDHSDIISILDQTIDFLKEKNANTSVEETETYQEEDFDPNRTLH